jgi:hypothetical protein
MTERFRTRIKRLESLISSEESKLKKLWPDSEVEGAVAPYKLRVNNILTARRVLEWLESDHREVDTETLYGKSTNIGLKKGRKIG